MSAETDRLSAWLHENAPEPPHCIHLDDLDLDTRTLTRPVTRRWLPLMAAACVLALAIALVVTLGRNHTSTPPTQPRPSYRLGLVTTPPPSRPPVRLAVTPWEAQVIAKSSLRENTLIGYRGALYAIGAGSPLTIARIDPRTGSTVVGRTHSPAGDSQLVAAGGLIWTFTHEAGQSGGDLDGFDPADLQSRARTFVDVGADDDVSLAASADDSLLYVGSGQSIRVFDATNGTLRHTLVIGHRVISLSASPDGHTLYVIRGSATTDVVAALDPTTGATQATYQLVLDGSALQATNVGFFVTLSSGNSAQIEYFAARASGPVQVTIGGGGPSPEVRISGDVAWAGGNRQLACADPVTGVVLSIVGLGRSDQGSVADISGVTALGGHVYAIYEGLQTGDHALIELHPPAACGLH